MVAELGVEIAIGSLSARKNRESANRAMIHRRDGVLPIIFAGNGDSMPYKIVSLDWSRSRGQGASPDSAVLSSSGKIGPGYFLCAN